jgi:hypothetical protein
VGSCLVSSRFTLHQTDLTYSPPVWQVGPRSSVFGAIGARSAMFLHEDYTTSTTVFQQAKDSFYGIGPIGGLGYSLVMDQSQIYVKAEGGNLFAFAHSLDREMVVANNSTLTQAVEGSSFRGVPMLGIEAGVVFYQSERSSLGVSYRFDYWWNLGGLGGSSLDWSRHQIEFDLRRRF